MTVHAKLAPSAAARWIACPGSIKLSESAPPQGPGRAANEGTDAHEVAARILLGEEVPEHDYPGIELYIEHVRAACRREGARVWIEKRVHLTEHVNGTPDAVIHCDDVLEVVDLKYGYNRVEARGNPQLMIYAAGAIATHSLKAANVKLTIVQPRAGGIRSVTMPIEDFTASCRPLIDAAAIALGNGAGVRRAGAHCQYCPAAPICPERKAEALRAAQMTFTEPVDIDDETKIWVHENAKRILDWFEAVEAQSLTAPPQGYRVVNGRGRRVWRTDIEIPKVLKAMTLVEAAKAGHDLDALTVMKEGNPVLVPADSSPEDFSEI